MRSFATGRERQAAVILVLAVSVLSCTASPRRRRLPSPAESAAVTSTRPPTVSRDGSGG